MSSLISAPPASVGINIDEGLWKKEGERIDKVLAEYGEIEQQNPARQHRLKIERLFYEIISSQPSDRAYVTLAKERILEILETPAVLLGEEKSLIKNLAKYKQDEALRLLVQEVEYQLSSTCLDRCVHHLRKSLCNMAIMSKGAAYVCAGLGLMVTALKVDGAFGYAVAFAGAGLVAAPLVAAVYNAWYKKGP
jgi:hypothetical protein